MSAVAFLAAFPSLVPTAPPAEKTVVLDFPAADAVLDAARGHLYLSLRDEHELVQLDLAGEVTRTWTFDLPAESLTITPDGTRLFVALLTQKHLPDDWGDHTGRIAELDLELGEIVRTFPIDEDPWDIVATDRHLIVMPGSGGYDTLRSYDLASTAGVGSLAITPRRGLSLHPGQTRVYSSGWGGLYTVINRIDVDPDTGALVFAAQIFDTEHPLAGECSVHPSGQYVITRGGGVYTSTERAQDDMRFVRALDLGSFQTEVFDTTYRGLLTTGPGTVDYYNLDSFEAVARAPVGATPEHLFVAGRDLLALDVTVGQTVLTVTRSPSSFSEGNTAPHAVFHAGPAPLLPEREIKLDAGLSTDDQDGFEDLRFRWDLTGDGVFDTPFEPSPMITRAYPYAGTKIVTLEVKDPFGAVGRVRQRVDVQIVTGPVAPLTPRALFDVPFRATDIEFDALHSRIYMSCSEQKRVFQVDRWTGFITDEWDYAYPPEAMTITPDGRWLYVALVSQGHDGFDFDEHSGHIAEIDLALGEQTRLFEINEDPWDIVATDSRYLIVTSGSGQWDDIRCYDLETLENTGTAGIYWRSVLVLHPSQTRVYAADTGLSPSDIHRFDLNPTSGRLVPRGDSIYHGEHPMNGKVFAHPDGTRLFTRGGGVYASTAVVTTDMRYLTTLAGGAEAMAFAPNGSTFVRAHWFSSRLSLHDAADLTWLGDVDLPSGQVEFLRHEGAQFLAVTRGEASTLFTRVRLAHFDRR